MAADPPERSLVSGNLATKSGLSIVNQPNSLVWNELQTNDLEAAKAFYGAVFGWTNEVDKSGYVVLLGGRPWPGRHDED